MRKFSLFFVFIIVFGLVGCYHPSSDVTEQETLPEGDFQEISDIISFTPKFFLVFYLEHHGSGRPQSRGPGYLMYRRQDGYVQTMEQYPCAYGMQGWRKEVRGDERTPIGKYRITNKERKNRRYPRYTSFGPRRFTLNYPNRYDQQAGRTGSGIMIHGGQVAPTLGCIRVMDGTNGNLSFGDSNVKRIDHKCPVGTLVFVSDDIHPALIGRPGRVLTLRASGRWNYLLDSELSNTVVLRYLRR
ncbi:MAG: L,D-transpeptidase family protein [Candidatus Electryoneaceae bacterium]|nr:L,D-transpeptidase family protein [Candidatus Electryoneaceae bacterium]